MVVLSGNRDLIEMIAHMKNVCGAIFVPGQFAIGKVWLERAGVVVES